MQTKLNNKEIFSIDITSQRQFANIKIVLNEEMSVLLFAGLETDKDALLRQVFCLNSIFKLQKTKQ